MKTLLSTRLALAGAVALFTHTTFAQTWLQTGAPLGYWSSVASSADGSRVLAADGGFNGAGGSLYLSPDSGATWTPTSAPVLIWSSAASSADGSHLVATAYNDRIYRSTDSGATWTATGAASTPWWAVIASADGSKLVAADSGSSVSGGGIYTSQSTPAPVLKLTSSGGTAALSWTVPSTIFTLQQNSDLNTTNWTDVAIAPTLNTSNLQNQVIVSSPGDNQFYRLKH